MASSLVRVLLRKTIGDKGYEMELAKELLPKRQFQREGSEEPKSPRQQQPRLSVHMHVHELQDEDHGSAVDLNMRRTIRTNLLS